MGFNLDEPMIEVHDIKDVMFGHMTTPTCKFAECKYVDTINYYYFAARTSF